MADVRATIGKLLVATIAVCAAGLLVSGVFSANGNVWELTARIFALVISASTLATLVLAAEWAVHVYRVETAKFPKLAPVQFSLRWMLSLVCCAAVVLGWGTARGFNGYLFVLLCVITLFVVITPFSKTRRERAREYELRKRLVLDDDAFFARFYAKTAIPRDIPVRLRGLWEHVFGESMDRLHPTDNLALMYDDLDFADVLYRVEREFGVTIPKSAFAEIDGSFDSIVRYLAKIRAAPGMTTRSDVAIDSSFSLCSGKKRPDRL